MKEVLREKITIKGSSLVDFLIYDYTKKELQVKYRRGKRKGELRTYQDIPKSAYHDLISAESKGKELLKILSIYKKEKKGFFSFFSNIFNASNTEPY